MNDRDWLVPGAEAVVLQPWDRGALRAQSVVVERVLKRDVVLNNGDRFNKDTLEKKIGGSWGTILYLVQPDDPRVAKTHRLITERRLRDRAKSAYEEWNRGKATPSAVISEFQRIIDFEGENE